MADFDLKQDLILSGLEELAIWGITSTPDNAEISRGLKILEQMMSAFFADNIDVGYQFEDDPNPASPSGVERPYQYPVAVNLASRLAPSYGKKNIPGLRTLANGQLSFLYANTAITRPTTYPRRMPRGSGSTQRFNRWRRFFVDPVKAPISASTNIVRLGETNDYVERWDAYLTAGEVIDSFTIDVGPSIELVSSSNTDTDVLYRITAPTPTPSSLVNVTGATFVTIVVTTSTGRVSRRNVNFQVSDFVDLYPFQ